MFTTALRSRLIRDVVPVSDRFMARVSLTRIRRAHHVDVADTGVVSLDVALQLVKKRAMCLSWVTERLRCVCLRHTTNYAEVGSGACQPVGISLEALPCDADMGIDNSLIPIPRRCASL
jgi:hypothetical protein